MTSTLKLNANYMPMEIVDSRDALVLVLTGKASTLESTGKLYHSMNLSVEEPSVIVMHKFINIPYKEGVQLNRRNLLARDNHECQFVGCNKKATTIDHIHPRSKGGRHEWTNVVAACVPCNAKKAAKTLKQLNWKLKNNPKVPAGDFWIRTINAQEGWNSYLEPWTSHIEHSQVS